MDPIDTGNSTTHECDFTFLSLEFGLSNFAAILFFITGPINFYQIRSIGFNRIVQFSPMFKVKINMSRMMAFLKFILMIVAIID